MNTLWNPFASLSYPMIVKFHSMRVLVILPHSPDTDRLDYPSISLDFILIIISVTSVTLSSPHSVVM